MAPTPPISRRQPTRIGKCFNAAVKATAKNSGGKAFATQAVIAPCCSSEVMPSGAKLSAFSEQVDEHVQDINQALSDFFYNFGGTSHE